MNWHGIISRLLAKTRTIVPPHWRLPIRYRALVNSPDAEPELLQLFSLCRNFRCAVDIGCSHGYYAYKMLERFERVFAFDANRAADLDIRHFQHKNLRYFPIGLADKAGTQNLKIPVRRGVQYIGWASVAERELPFAEGFETISVSLQRLDDQAFVFDSKIDLIKIDVEGFELEVILGGLETIRRNKPVLIIEHNAGQSEAIRTILKNLGYRQTTMAGILGKAIHSPNCIYLPAR